MFRTVCVSLAAFALTASAGAQSAASTPIKPGLWETTITSTSQVQLPPDLQARMDAMTPEQQAMMKANMPGMAGGGAPVTTTTHSCSTGQTVNDLLNQAQQKGTQCKLTNQTETASSMSFDISCTMPQGSASGHSSFTMADSDHVTGATHVTATMTGARGGSGAMTIDSTLTSHYLGADCGDVKPNSSVVMPK